MDWVMVGAISTAFMALVIFATALIAVWQLFEIRKSRQSDAFMNLILVLQREDIREARRILREELANKEFKNWSKDEKKQAERACHTYDTAGLMSSKKHIDSKLVVEWHDSIVKCWEAAYPMIMEYRKARSEDFWHNFEELYKMAKKYEETKKV